MAIVKTKPTSAGRRHLVKVVNDELFKGRAYAPLLEKQSKSGGRNNNGRITTRHIGGGHRHHYRLVDFKRNKDGIPAIVERLEYDPNRSANIALVKYLTANVATSLRRKASLLATVSSLVLTHRSRKAMLCRCAMSRWAPPFTV